MINTIPIPLFSLTRYLILSQILSNSPGSNNIKCVNSPQLTLINPSILSNLIHNCFGPIEVSMKCHKLKYFHVFSSN